MMLRSLLPLLFSLWPMAAASVPCNDTHNFCSDLLWEGSKCHEGRCTNPFQDGCLRALLNSPEYKDKYNDGAAKGLKQRVLNKPRVCNSDDGPDVKCTPSEKENDFPETRIYSQSWDASAAQAWIIQIIYSELLGVPSTVESGAVDATANFYDKFNRLDYATGNEYQVIENSLKSENGDCSIYERTSEAESYIPCANFIMDVWYEESWSKIIESGEACLDFNGIGVRDDWYITQFSVEKDPSLLSHFGLMGEENRRKLAETFKRPTTWKVYCEEISLDNCATDDGVAKRYPKGSEEKKYFSLGDYTGHFRATAENDCDTNPSNCTGYFVNYPSFWTSFFKQQAFHLGIALESDSSECNGYYSADDMVDIWRAANATKSDVIGMWWYPDTSFSLFRGSGSDMLPVQLPFPTQECLDSKLHNSDECKPNQTEDEMYGDSKGACANKIINTFKLAATNFQSSIEHHDNQKARMTPAYKVYDDFTMSTAVLDDLLTRWVDRGVDPAGFDPRLATCRWVADNLEHIAKAYIPQSYPRTFVESYSTAFTVVAVSLGAISTLVVVITTLGIAHKVRKGTLSKSAQLTFLLLVLAGLLMVSVGAVLQGLPPTNQTCTSSMWMIVIGYTTQLVPTLIKVNAINKLVREAKKLRRYTVDKKKMLCSSICFCALSAVYCLFWTIFDSPELHSSFQVTSDQNAYGETIVLVSDYCASTSNAWQYIFFTCQGLLLVLASLLAYQMRHAPNAVNESKPLALMVYASFFFLTLRFVLFAVTNTTHGSASMKASLQMSSSICNSLDAIVNVVIYFFRFFLKKDTKQRITTKCAGAQQFFKNIAQREGEVNIATPALNQASNLTASELTSSHLKSDPEGAEDISKFPDEEFAANDCLIILKSQDGDETISMPKWAVEKYRVKEE